MDISDIWQLTARDGFLTAMEGHVSRKCAYGEDMSALSGPERVYYTVRTFESEVMNGGIGQFLSNSSASLAGDVSASLREIGAPVTAGIAERALASTAYPSDFDHLLYAYPEDLAELCYRYILSNRESFS